MSFDIQKRPDTVAAPERAFPHSARDISIRLTVFLAVLACGVFAPMGRARAAQANHNSPQHGFVAASLIEKAAVFYGAQRWPGCRLISITPYYALDGSINAYAAQFAKRGSGLRRQAALAERLAAVQAEQARMSIVRLPEEKRQAANEAVLADEAGTVIIAARCDLYPLLERFDGAAPHLKHASKAAGLAAIGKGRAAKIERSFYLGSLSVLHQVRPEAPIAGEDAEPALVDPLNGRTLTTPQQLPDGAGVLPPAPQQTDTMCPQSFWEEIDRSGSPPTAPCPRRE